MVFLKTNLHYEKFPFVLIVFFCFSCKKNNDSNSEQHLFENLSLETQSLLKQQDMSSMKQSYSMLTDDEQEKLWAFKLSYILKHDELTQKQNHLLTKMLHFLTENGISSMKKNNMIPDHFMNENANSFYENFSAEQLYFIIEHPFIKEGFSLKYAKEYLINPDYRNSANLTNSTARVEGSCSCRYDIGCGLGNSCNTNSSCSGGNNCGLFGTSTCKGTCERGSGVPVLS